jgi:hypothetical protein
VCDNKRVLGLDKKWRAFNKRSFLAQCQSKALSGCFEIDINPLFVSPKQIVALDARVVLHDSEIREADLPQSPIRPYPSAVKTVSEQVGFRLRFDREADEWLAEMNL